jgi:hypothetical protein
VGVFIKQRAPNQLLMPGVLGVFGRNSPHHLQHNPPARVSLWPRGMLRAWRGCGRAVCDVHATSAEPAKPALQQK